MNKTLKNSTPCPPAPAPRDIRSVPVKMTIINPVLPEMTYTVESTSRLGADGIRILDSTMQRYYDLLRPNDVGDLDEDYKHRLMESLERSFGEVKFMNDAETGLVLAYEWNSVVVRNATGENTYGTMYPRTGLIVDLRTWLEQILIEIPEPIESVEICVQWTIQLPIETEPIPSSDYMVCVPSPKTSSEQPVELYYLDVIGRRSPVYPSGEHYELYTDITTAVNAFRRLLRYQLRSLGYTEDHERFDAILFRQLYPYGTVVRCSSGAMLVIQTTSSFVSAPDGKVSYAQWHVSFDPSTIK